MRLLVLDGSRILASLLRRLVPGPVDIEEASTFEDAVARLSQDPPDAVIANVTPADLPWQELKNLCQRQEPKIPVIFESCVFRDPIEAGIGSLSPSAAFLAKPYDLEALRTELTRLLGDGLKLDSDPRGHGARARGLG